jgi:hypothetical protein
LGALAKMIGYIHLSSQAISWLCGMEIPAIVPNMQCFYGIEKRSFYKLAITASLAGVGSKLTNFGSFYSGSPNLIAIGR